MDLDFRVRLVAERLYSTWVTLDVHSSSLIGKGTSIFLYLNVFKHANMPAFPGTMFLRICLRDPHPCQLELPYEGCFTIPIYHPFLLEGIENMNEPLVRAVTTYPTEELPLTESLPRSSMFVS